jgi:TQXA domain-containing protein/LPXTG-motif cell wall-anchored protein
MAAPHAPTRSTVRFAFLCAPMLLIVGILIALGGTAARPASAEPQPRLPPLGESPGLFTELTITGVVDGQAASGFDAPSGFDPLDGYPDDIPAGSTTHIVSFAGTIAVEDTLTGRTALTYCIDLHTDTQAGVHYKMGDWTEAEVPNLGYIGYILRNYFPTTGEPAAANDDQRAAAVQAAIWFFSDNYILAATSPLRALTAAIVADVLENGPVEEPENPQLTVTPSQLAAPASGEIVGPFHVEADGSSTIRSVGVEVFTDPNGDHLLEDGDEVPAGTTLWVRTVSDDTPQGFVLERQVTALVSSVYLYDGSNTGVDDAQKLVLAQEAELVKRAGALITPFPAGALEVTKNIGGTGAGFQGEVVIEVTCEDPDGELDQTFTRTLDARTATGDHSIRIGGILAGSTCTISETTNGDNDFVNVRSMEINPKTVTIAEDETVQASVANIYDRAYGALQVTKTIAGKGAGSQGTIVVQVTCDDPVFNRKFTIPAGSPANSYPQAVIDGIPAGTRCTVTEPATGENDAVELTGAAIVTPSGTRITDGVTAAIAVRNTYVPRDMVPSGDSVRTLPATGAPQGLVWAAVAGGWLLLSGLALLFHQRRRVGRRRAAE